MAETGGERVARRIYGALLRLLPRELEREAGADMAATFAARIRDARSRGRIAALALFARELLGVLGAALRGRVGAGRRAGAERRSGDRPPAFAEGLGQDLRFVARSLGRSPGFTLAAVLVIALGVASSTGIFSAVNAVLLRPLPFRDPERLVMMWERNPDRGWVQVAAAPANALDWRERVPSLQDVALYDEFESGLTLVGPDGAEQLPYTMVSGNFFDVLGVRPAVGRGLSWEDTWKEPGPPPRVVLSWDTWTTRFGADPTVVGTIADFAGARAEIAGVAPQGFAFPSANTRMWMSYGWPAAQRHEVFMRRAHWTKVVGRLAPGATIERTDAELQAVAAQLEREHPETNVHMGAGMTSLHDFLVGNRRTPLLVLLGAVGLLLLIACSNVASLLLVRAQARARELAVRRAMGAAGGRLVRLVLLEALVLSVAGGVLGFALGAAGVRALDGLRSLTLPGVGGLEVDARVIAFTVGTLAACTLLFGLVPALRARSAEPNDVLRDGERGGRGRRAARATHLLVVAEVALSLLLVIGSGLMVRSFLALRSVDPGMRTENVMTFRVSAPERRYPEYADMRSFFERLEERLEALPEVVDVAYVRILSLTTPSWSSDFTVSSESLSPTGSRGGTQAYATGGTTEGREVLHREVSPDYFEVVEVPLVAGRAFTAADGLDTPPVVVVNEAFVRQHFPGRAKELLGLRITNDRPPAARSTWRTIVGVVGDERQAGLSTPARPEIFAPMYQDWNRGSTVVMRTRGRPEAALPGARAVLEELDPLTPAVEPRSMDAVVAQALARDRFLLVLVTAFAGAAATLAAVGVYGVTAQAARRRTREIGIRLALGADASSVRRMVLRQGMGMVALGVALGLGGAFAGARVMRSLLYQVAPTDPVTFAIVPLLLTAVALTACWLPARRATRVDPVTSLRAE